MKWETDIQELCIEWKSGNWRQVLFGIYQERNKRGANLSSFWDVTQSINLLSAAVEPRCETRQTDLNVKLLKPAPPANRW